jgi:hypothetical protein
MTLTYHNRRSSTPPIDAISIDGVLPLDVLINILLRLPTEAICCLRAVCRSWRSLLCHPDFIAAAQNPGPLLAAAVPEHRSGDYTVTILDTESGDDVKWLNVDDWRSCSLDYMCNERLVCVIGQDKQIRLLDPATGAFSVLPDYAPVQYASAWCTIGRAASTGEYKVLVIQTTPTIQVCKILTLGGRGWRETGRPPLKLVTLSSVSSIESATGWESTRRLAIAVVNGVVYMLGESVPATAHQMIIEFDLECEAWRPAASLRGPLINLLIISLIS